MNAEDSIILFNI